MTARLTRQLARTAACLASLSFILPAALAPNAAASGDTHIVGIGLERTIDCNNNLLLVNGANNIVTAKGVCRAVTVQGSGNTIVADTILSDVTVYGWDQTVLFHNGAPQIVDRGRELGMANRISWTPA